MKTARIEVGYELHPVFAMHAAQSSVAIIVERPPQRQPDKTPATLPARFSESQSVGSNWAIKLEGEDADADSRQTCKRQQEKRHVKIMQTGFAHSNWSDTMNCSITRRAQ